MRPDMLGGLAVFRVVAAERSFTRAATGLGVTQSALSQTVKRLEADLGIRLLATLEPAIADIETELSGLRELRDRPSGTLRVTVGRHAAETVLLPTLVRLLSDHPDIEFEASVDDGYIDIVAGRFDAGIRLGERLEADMIAMRVGPNLKMAVVASPAYLQRNGRPRHPTDLRDHRCITFRGSDGGVRPWDFSQGVTERTCLRHFLKHITQAFEETRALAVRG